MIGYCILGGILIVFLFGVTSIICDAIYNKEEDFIFVQRKPKEDFAKFIADNYTDADYDDD
jgi:uncharacterized membrane protein